MKPENCADMATLQKIIIQNYRNIALQELDFSRNVNCICGGNGEGKTNLLDAIWYLSMTKSAFSSSDRFVIRHGQKEAGLSGTYLLEDGKKTKISIHIEPDADKKVKRDDKAYSKLSEHIGLLPVVMVSPSDEALVSDTADERRRFLNAVISQMDREYLSEIQKYNRLLLQRNALLKKGRPDSSLLEVLDVSMDAPAEKISAKREEFTKAILPLVQKYYETISGGKETVGIEYRTDLRKGKLSSLLKDGLERDIVLKFTGNGVQRDDLVFTMDGYPIRKCGSQGQQKSFLVALKFAQYELMKEGGSSPILLLDDLFDKLDMGRVSNLLGMVSRSEFGQIFISDTNRERTMEVVDSLTKDRAIFSAEGGVFKYE